MKRVYIVPESEIIIMNGGKIMDPLTDSIGEWGKDHPFDAKENNLVFEEDDSFGDTWGVDSNNLWGDEE